MDPWIHGSAAGAAARAAAGAAASAAAVCIYYVLGALTLGQRIKRDLASHGKNRGSRAGEHEQPNAGRKRKRHFFFLRFVGRTLSHARRQGVTRNARTCENRTRKASQETTRTSPDEPKSRPRRSKTPLGAQSDKQKPSQAVPGRSGDALKAAHDAHG